MAPVLTLGGSRATVDVRDYSTFQAAIDALPDRGGTVYIPAGRYTPSTTPAVGPMTIDKAVHFFGDTNGRDGEMGAVIEYTGTSSDLLTVSSSDADWTLIENCFFLGAQAAGAGRGLVFHTIDNLAVRNCTFYGFPSYAVATGTGSDAVRIVFEKARFINSYSGALVSLGEGTAVPFQTTFFDSSFASSSNAPQCLRIGTAPRVAVRDSSIEHNENPASVNGDTAAMIYSTSALGTNKLEITGNWFENNHADATSNSWFIYMVAPSTNTNISNNYFRRTSGTATKIRAIKTVTGGATGNYGLHITNNLGDLGGATNAGTDDIVLSANDTAYLLNNTLRDGGGYSTAMAVSAGAEIVHNNIATIFTKTTTGAPASGTWPIGAMCINTFDVALYVCTVAGSPGTWKSEVLS